MMEGRWWAIKIEGYNSWTFAESEAEQARRNGYEVHGPFVRCDDAAIERAKEAVKAEIRQLRGDFLPVDEMVAIAFRAAGERP